MAMKPRTFVFATLILLGVGAAIALTSGPPAEVVESTASTREIFAAVLGFAVLAFVAMGWDGYIER